LLAVTLAATLLLCLWLWRARNTLTGLGLGAIVGGALGNGYDRFIFGAVVDFLDFHAFGYHFYVFNLADSAITLGVALLLFDALLAERRARRSAGETA
jgi:signal peptidase II